MRQLLPLPADPDRPVVLEDLYSTEPGAPLLRAGFVASLDGAIAVDGTSAGLSSPADKAVFRALRAVCDAVVVGAGTARAEDYGAVRVSGASGRLFREGRGLPQPVLVLVSRSLDLDPEARCFTESAADGVPLLVLTCGDATAPDGLVDVAELVVCGESAVDLAAGLSALRDRGLHHLLCEGGPGLLTDLLRAGLVDELCLTTTPVLAGDAPRLVGELEAPVALRTVHLLDGGDGVLLGRYALTASPGSPGSSAVGRSG